MQKIATHRRSPSTGFKSLAWNPLKCRLRPPLLRYGGDEKKVFKHLVSFKASGRLETTKSRLGPLSRSIVRTGQWSHPTLRFDHYLSSCRWLNSDRAAVIFSLIWLLCTPGCNNTANGPPQGLASKAVEKAEQGVRFSDVTKALQLEHTYRNGEESNRFGIIESIGGGLAVLDFDRDGWPDFFFPGGGLFGEANTLTPLAGALWRNEFGSGFSNVAKSSRSDAAMFYSHGAAVGDINNDGFPELLVTGFGGLQLFVNQGDGTFIELGAAFGLNDSSWSTSAGFGDFDNDGFLDLYVAHYVDWSLENNPECKSSGGTRDVCPPGAFTGLQDVVFMNNGDGSFRSVTSETGLVPEGKGLGVVCADINDDSKLDVYVANDTTNNFLYVNQGSGMFLEMGVASGTALDERGTSNGSMGISVLDFDGDLRPDIWVCNYENETFALYKNDGNSNFRHVTSSTGVSALGTLFVAFGTVAADFDSDGDEDIVVANGHVQRLPPGNTVEQFPLFLTNSGKGRLARQLLDPSNYFSKKWRGRGVVALDYDRDGDLDLGFSNVNQPAALLENQSPGKGNWCSLELIGTKSNRDCIGAKVLFQTDKKRYLRIIYGGGSYLSQNPYWVHCAFPKEEQLQQTEITWPDGSKQSVADIQVNQFNRIVEP